MSENSFSTSWAFFRVATLLLAAGLAGCATSGSVQGLQTDINKLQDQLTDVQKNQADLTVKMETLTQNLQALNQRLDQNKQSMSQLTGKLEDVSASFAGLTQQIAKTQPVVPVVPPSKLFDEAYRDFTKKHYDLAALGFQQIVEQFPTSSVAPDAAYWAGECFYSKGDFAKALEAYDKLIGQFPASDKIGAGRLKKAFCLLELKRDAEARPILESLVKEKPGSVEAERAAEKLEEMAQQVPAVRPSTATQPSPQTPARPR